MPRQLTVEERDRIAQLRQAKTPQQDIAKALGRAPSTISRELRRNRTGETYYAGQAQRLAETRRRERPLVRRMDDPQVNAAVRSGLAQQWSPVQISGRLKREHPTAPERRVSAQTIYTWIERDACREHWRDRLRRRGKRPSCRKKTASPGAPIADRPEVIEQRSRLGDFEGDTVLGPPGSGGLATLVDRKSRYTILLKVSSKDANHVHARLKHRLKKLDEEHRRSLTFDNGTEFARCRRLERHLGIQLYFADPGCPYQRGTNENTNGLVRQYFPKGTDFRDVSHAEVRRVEHLLNHRPRACLGFQTPAEVFFENRPPDDCD